MHSTLILLLVVSMVGSSVGAGAAASDAPITPDRKVPLFNGKDLSNWEPDVPGARYRPEGAGQLRRPRTGCSSASASPRGTC